VPRKAFAAQAYFVPVPYVGKMKEGDLNDESFSGFFQNPHNENAVTFIRRRLDSE
jgi:hypothetical protein